MAHKAKGDFEAYIRDSQSVIPAQSTSTDAPFRIGTRPFTARSALEAYWTNKRIKEALQEISHRFRFTDSEVTTIRKRFIAVFSTLVLTTNIEAIYHVIRYTALEDQHLPFSPRERPPEKWPSDGGDFKLFYDEQWQFCPWEFTRDSLMSDPEIEEDRILPLLQRKELRFGDLSYVSTIKIHEDYNFLGDGISPTSTNEFVLKTYHTKEGRRCYDNEIYAFKSLMGCNASVDNLIRFYGSWRQGNTYNILLEYANCTLLDYFRTVGPPTKEEDITKFWKAMLSIIEPVKHMHELHELDGPHVLHGIHQDIKPENILVLRSSSGCDYDVEFKLADLGLSQFQKTVGTNAEPVESRDTYGTQSYSAPECCRVDSLQEGILKVTSKVDIWSLGCVFSEAATWVVLGETGREEYATQRRDYINDKFPEFAEAGYGDCFHDRHHVLPPVKLMQGRISSERRLSDRFTEHMIPLIWQMLEPNVYLRCDAAHVIRTRHRIFESISDSRYARAYRTLEGPVVQQPDHVSSSVSIRDTDQRSFYTAIPSQTSPEIQPSPGIPNLNGGSFRRIPPQTPPGMQANLRRSQSPYLESYPYEGDANPNSNHGPQDLGIYRSSTLENGHTSHDNATANVNGFVSLEARARFGRSSGIDPRHSRTTELQRSPTVDSTSRDRFPPPDDPRHSVQELRPTITPAPPLALGRTTSVSYKAQQRPYLTIEQVIQHEEARKYPYQGYHGKLKGRDHVFLIDDSASMSPVWYNLVRVSRALAYMVENADFDGMDLYWASSSKCYNFTRRKDLITKITRRQQTLAGQCDMKFALGNVIERFRKGLNNTTVESRSKLSFLPRKSKKNQGLSIYVLTDGAWQDSPGPVCGVEEPIRILTKTLTENRQLDTKVGIQFIRFGNDQLGERRLEILDSQLKEYFPDISMDIVDTTKSDGNVLKMLLGAFDRYWDEDTPPQQIRSSLIAEPSDQRTTTSSVYDPPPT